MALKKHGITSAEHVVRHKHGHIAKKLNVPESKAKDILKHHILIPATTGRGKSNLVKTILYNLMENDNCGKLVFDYPCELCLL